jgi:SAM-dependent methyltransferase
MRGYDLFARLYDLEHSDHSRDLELYRNFAARCGGRVLELGCGTGRVALDLAKAGFEVVGIDDSSAMLALARLHAMDAGLGEKVDLKLMDVRTFRIEHRFSLAIFALNGFLHLTSVADQLAALRSVHRALLPGGFLIVDVPNPHESFTPDMDGLFLLRRRFRSEEGSLVTSMVSTHTDLATQVQEMTLTYDEVGADGRVQRTAVEMELRFVYRYEMEILLRQAGFKLDAVYGSHDLELYESDSETMLFVAYT